MIARARSAAIGWIAIALLASACATVAPYQRERLAARDMTRAGVAELHAGEAHADDYREGARGGFDSAIGGCGCN